MPVKVIMTWDIAAEREQEYFGRGRHGNREPQLVEPGIRRTEIATGCARIEQAHGATVVRSEPTYLEILPSGVTKGTALEEGIYVGLLGPSYETPAEVRLFRTFGGDAVGMSTVLEAIACRWAGLEVAGISLVTNPGAGYSGVPLSHEEVLAAGLEAGPRLAGLIRRFVRDLG